MGKTVFLGLWQFAFCESSFLAIVHAIVRIVRDCTKIIAEMRFGWVGCLFVCGLRFFGAQ
jgi:hypothetical protein